MNFFIYTVGFLLFFMATFVNDYNIEGFPVFYLIWFSIVLFRLLLQIDIRPFEFLSQILLFVLLQPPFFVESFDTENVYIHGYIFAVLYINVIFLIPYFMSKAKYLRSVIIAIFLAASAVSLLSIVQGDNRASIYFGPNVLYRIYGLLFALFLLSYYFEDKFFFNKSLFWLVFIMFVINLVATGSRGAIVVFAIPFAYLLLKKGAFQIKTLHVLFALIPALAALCYFIFTNLDMFWRLFYFDLDGESIGARLEYLNLTLAYAENFSFNLDYMFGQSSLNPLWSNYPHNFALESFVYGGLWMLVVVMLPLVVFIYNAFFTRDKFYIILFFAYLPIFIGASVSGNLTYNFPVISVPFVAFVYAFLNARRSNIPSLDVFDNARTSSWAI